MSRPAQHAPAPAPAPLHAVPPAPAAPAKNEEFVVSEQLWKHKDQFGRKMVNAYVLYEKLGVGQHGTVRKAVDRTPGYNGRTVAIKIVKRNNPRQEKWKQLRKRETPLPRDERHTPFVARISETEAKIRKEIAIMKKCKHAHIVRLLEVIDDIGNDKIYMVMEYMGGGEVKWRTSDEKPTLTVDQSRRIVRDVILGLEYLHYNGIIHRDIKPANLLWSTDRQRVKIADFGVSHFSYAQTLGAASAAATQKAKKRKGRGSTTTSDQRDQDFIDQNDQDLFNDNALSTMAGTPPFLAPELIVFSGFSPPAEGENLPAPPRREVTKAIDVWALGVTLYCLLFGRVPWMARNVQFPEIATYGLIMHRDWTTLPEMGLDRLPTGGRRPPQIPIRTRTGKEVAQPEGAIITRVLDSLLQKDAHLRITLDDLKRHPWILRDIADVQEWLKATSPNKSARLHVTDEDARASLSPLRFMWDRTRTISKSAVNRLRSIPSKGSIASRQASISHSTPKAEQKATPISAERQRSIRRKLQTPSIPISIPSSSSKSTKHRPDTYRQDSSPEFSRNTFSHSHHNHHPSNATTEPNTPRNTSRRSSDALNHPNQPPTPSPAGSTIGSGAASPSIYGHASAKARASIASLLQLFPLSKFMPGSGSGSNWTTTSPSAAQSQVPSAMHSPVETTSPPLSGGMSAGGSPPHGRVFPRTGSTSAMWPRFSVDTSQQPQSSASVLRHRASKRGVSSYGVGGGQLSAEMRASSWGEPGDYHDSRSGGRSGDVMSIHSGEMLPEEVMLVGAGGYADSPTMPVHTPSVSPGANAYVLNDLAAALPGVSPAHLPVLVDGGNVIPAHADPATHAQESASVGSGAYLKRVASGKARSTATSPLALSANTSSELVGGMRGSGDEYEYEEEEEDGEGDGEGSQWSSSSDELPNHDGMVEYMTGTGSGTGSRRHSSSHLGGTMDGEEHYTYRRRPSDLSYDDDEDGDGEEHPGLLTPPPMLVGSPGRNIYAREREDADVFGEDDEDDESVEAPVEIRRRDRRGSNVLSISPA